VFDNCSGDCGWPEVAHALSADTVRQVLPVVQWDVARCRAARKAQALLSSCDLALLTPGSTTRLEDNTIIACGRHRLGLGAPTSVFTRPCLLRRR
jgi:hypothetical protein